MIGSGFLGVSINYLNGTLYPIVALLFYISSFSLGLASLTYVIPTEVFPLEYRAKCVGLSLFINRLLSALVSFMYP